MTGTYFKPFLKHLLIWNKQEFDFKHNVPCDIFKYCCSNKSIGLKVCVVVILQAIITIYGLLCLWFGLMLWHFPRPSSTIYISLDKPDRLIIRLLFGCSSDYYLTNSTNIQILRRQCCLLLILPSTFSFFSSIIFFPTKKARLHNLWDILQAWVEPSSQRESAGELLIIPPRLLVWVFMI